MKEQITQGSIIADVRTLKYSEIRCKGIVISARCDFANEKIKYFHCLSAMTVKDWIYEVLYAKIVEELMRNALKNIEKYATKKELDIGTLEEFGLDRTRSILEKKYREEKNELKKVKECLAEWEKCTNALKSNDRTTKRAFLSDKKANKLYKDKMKSLYNSAYPKFCFIPQKAYSETDSSVEGIVVDLQDIKQYDISLKNDIETNNFDFQTITSGEKRYELNQMFFFEENSDFVIIEGLIKSPWIEYLLQLFANSFIRIGVENASTDEVERFSADLFKETSYEKSS